MILGAMRSYYAGHINRHLTNIEILLNNSVGIGEHQDIVQSVDTELEKLAVADDKLTMVMKYLERSEANAEQEKKESKSK